MFTLTPEERTSLIKIEIELFHQSWEEAEFAATSSKRRSLMVNRLYYACYHCANALLLADGATCKTHSGIIQEFNRRFLLTGRISQDQGRVLRQLFNLRLSGEYDGIIKVDDALAEELWDKAKMFCSLIDNVSR